MILQDDAVRGFERHDGRTRAARADRLVWLAKFQRNAAVAGRVEPLGLLEEARACFVNGHFIAVLLTATALIEQTLVEQLAQIGDVNPKRALKGTIEAARAARLAPDDVLKRADDLREKRNPYCHYREDGDEYALSTRFIVERRHPASILENDARDAVEVMYAVFEHALAANDARMRSGRQP
jgi:hypothetical protein